MADCSEEIDSLARRHSSLAVGALAKLLVSGQSEAARVAAASALLDRGFGRPGVATGDEAQPMIREPLPSAAVAIEARRYGRLAVEVLRRVAEHGTGERARVNACRALLDRGFGTIVAPKSPPGLKASAALAAETAGLDTDWGTDLVPNLMDRAAS
jgi:hypothetical protein